MAFLEAPRHRKPKTLSTQSHVFEDVHWSFPYSQEQLVNQSIPFSDLGLGSAPANEPYWEYTTHIESGLGLRLESVVARNTQSAGSVEPIFEKIEFTDINVQIGGQWIPFNITRAFTNEESRLEMGSKGTLKIGTTPDKLYHSGILLKLVDNVLSQDDGLCKVTVELSVVFRGSRGDFEPAGIPLAMLAFPQISFSWENKQGTTARVEKFRGTVKITIHNKMYHQEGMPSPPAANIASLFTDSNNNRDSRRRLWRAWGSHLREFGEWLLDEAIFWDGNARVPAYPFGWAMIFDYAKLGLQKDTEIDAVYGPEDDPYYKSTRQENYPWPHQQILSPRNIITVKKAPRQGMYDNTHIHAKMMPDKYGNDQVHAPFCGHSCVHLHWRWAAISDRGAPAGWGWKYKGWSKDQAHASLNQPLIPPNQKLRVAITHPNTSRHSETNIVNPSNPTSWEGSNHPDGNLRKSIWYSVDIFSPTADQKQVIMEHGIGWAYGYSWNDSVKGLSIIISDDLPDTDDRDPTQAELGEFFVNNVYPTFRYFEHNDSHINQIPPGGNTIGTDADTPVTSMENL